MQQDNDHKRVLIAASGKRFSSLPDASLLESGLASGVALPYRCANGSCGDCRAKVISGEVSKIRFHDYALTESEKLAGICLLCANTALTDLTIEVTEACSPLDIPLQSLRAKLCHVETMPDVAIVRFKLARGKALRYLAGQYATITSNGGNTVTLPIANCPCEPDYIEFHVPRPDSATESTASSQPGDDVLIPNQERALECNDLRWLSSIEPRERVTIEGPHGDFTISEPIEAGGNAQPGAVFFIAVATGFAAIKPLLEHMMSQDCGTPCTLVWIASASVSHYQHNLCRSWADAFDNVYYCPLNSIDEFTPELVKDRGMNQSDVRIYLSGDCGLNRRIQSVLEGSGVDEPAVQTDSLSP